MCSARNIAYLCDLCHHCCAEECGRSRWARRGSGTGSGVVPTRETNKEQDPKLGTGAVSADRLTDVLLTFADTGGRWG